MKDENIITFLLVLFFGIISILIVAAVFYMIFFSFMHNGLSPRGMEVDKFCKDNGWDKVVEGTADFKCENRIIKDNTLIITTKEVIWVNGTYYFLEERK